VVLCGQTAISLITRLTHADLAARVTRKRSRRPRRPRQKQKRFSSPHHPLNRRRRQCRLPRRSLSSPFSGLEWQLVPREVAAQFAPDAREFLAEENHIKRHSRDHTRSPFFRRSDCDSRYKPERRRPVFTTSSRSTWALRLSPSIRTVLNNTSHSARRPSPDGYGEAGKANPQTEGNLGRADFLRGYRISRHHLGGPAPPQFVQGPVEGNGRS
jgi:hypothetical protein